MDCGGWCRRTPHCLLLGATPRCPSAEAQAPAGFRLPSLLHPVLQAPRPRRLLMLLSDPGSPSNRQLTFQPQINPRSFPSSPLVQPAGVQLPRFQGPSALSARTSPFRRPNANLGATERTAPGSMSQHCLDRTPLGCSRHHFSTCAAITSTAASLYAGMQHGGSHQRLACASA
jgi:hypothetical protein